MTSCATMLLAMLSTIIAAIEAPVFTAGLGSCYKAAMMSYWMWGFVPWEHLVPEVYGHKLSLPIFLALSGGLAALLGCLLFALRRASGI
ncbi:unnamed protein product [Effrenium voratum]|nr:unnamed protein product [Effrenium voratum]